MSTIKDKIDKNLNIQALYMTERKAKQEAGIR